MAAVGGGVDMGDRGWLTRVLAVAGDLLVWVPLLAPLAFGLVRLAQSRRLLVDYLMPAELFPAVLLGAVLLMVAAFRAQSHRRIIGWSSAAAFGALAAGLLAASLTGLASRAYDPVGWRLTVVAGLLGGYVAAALVLALGGGSLVVRVLSKSPRDAGGASS